MSEAQSNALSTFRFIQELWSIAPSDHLVEFFFIQYRPTEEEPDAKRVRWLHYSVEHVLTNWSLVETELFRHNRTQVENIHHGVNPRARQPVKRGKNSDVDYYIALWIDVDFGTNPTGVKKVFWEAVEEIRKLGLGPSVIIESGNGLHAYWLLNKPTPVKLARPCCAGLQDFFKIADAVSDPSRVLRMPGFFNLKDAKNPKDCKIIEATYQRYEIEAFKDFALEPGKSAEEKQDEARHDTVHQAPASRDPRIEQIKRGVREGEGPYGGRHNAAIAMAGHYCALLKTRKLALYAMNEWNQLNAPVLPDDEILAAVEHAWSKEQIKKQEAKALIDELEGGKKKEKESQEGSGKPHGHVPWLDEDDNFNAVYLGRYMMDQNRLIATPIGDDGKGVNLYLYKDGVYRKNGNNFATSEVLRLLGPAFKASRLTETMTYLSVAAKVDYKNANKNSRSLINVRNGMLDWRTGELKPHDSKYLSLIQLDPSWDPKAESPELDQFFSELFPEDCIPLVEEFLGYLMIPDTRFQKAFIAIGAGGNGKGTFLKILKTFLGEDNVSAISIHQIEEDRFAVSSLFGKLVNIYHDLEPRILQSTGKFKSIVTGDPIGAEQKFKDQYTFEPYARLVFSANEFPRSQDKTDAYFDRLLFVPFPNRFRGSDKQILDYDQILIKKPGFMSALLRRAVAGLQRLMKNGKFSESPTSRAAIDEYRKECSNAIDFLTECCVREEKSQLSRKELYSHYSDWCETEGMKSLNNRNFAKAARSYGATDHKIGGLRVWLGVAWVNGAPPVSRVEEIRKFGEIGGKQGNIKF